MVIVCVFGEKEKRKKKEGKINVFIYSEPLNLAVIDLLYFLYTFSLLMTDIYNQEK